MICETFGICTTNQTYQLSPAVILILELVVIAIFLAYLSYIIHIKHWKTLKNIAVSTIAIVLFELMIDPAVLNTGFSSWTYFFHDLTFILTIGWIFLVSVSISLVDLLFPKLSEIKKFWLYLGTVDAITFTCEIFLVTFGMRHYAASTLQNSLGYFIPYTAVPVGVILVIPAAFGLVIGFTKFWEKVLHIE